MPKIKDLSEVIKLLWNLPHREYQYFALDLLDKFKNKVPAETIELHCYLIINKSWWDSVDLIASQLVGTIVKKTCID